MKKILAKAFALLLISTALFSFTSLPGGEGFEVYLNNKLVLQCYGNQMNTPQVLRFTEGFSAKDELSIKYHHCGKVGKNRVLTVRNEDDKILKEIRFADSDNASAAMHCKVTEILGLKKGDNSVLKLYYASSELPRGRLLASLVTSGRTVTAKP